MIYHNFSIGFEFHLAFCFLRDTPHHLKNKRVQHGVIDKAAANILLANTIKQQETNHKVAENSISETTELRDDAHDPGEYSLRLNIRTKAFLIDGSDEL